MPSIVPLRRLLLPSCALNFALLPVLDRDRIRNLRFQRSHVD